MERHCSRGETLFARRGGSKLIVVTLMILLVVCVAPSAAQATEGCNNESVRLEQGTTFLPECRAYEFVSPGSNPYLEFNGEAESARAAPDGDSIAYYSLYPANGAASGGFFYVASRRAGGWSTEEVAPQESPLAAEATACLPSIFFSEDLTSNVFTDGWDAALEASGETYCQRSDQDLVPSAFAGFGNLILTEADGHHQWVNETGEDIAPSNARLQDVTPDLSHIAFSEDAQLTPEALAGSNLYEWAGGTLQLVTYLPDGKSVVGRIADGGKEGSAEGAYEGQDSALAPATHAMSSNGETVFFYVLEAGRTYLYARVHAMQPPSEVNSKTTKVNGEQCIEPTRACTVEIDATQGSGTSGGGVFWDASEDGSRVFFADESKLTSNAGAQSGDADLYEYDMETRQLTDLTPESLAGRPADVRGYSGAAENGSYLYFVATAVLTGAQHNSVGDVAVAEHPNLYLEHNGALVFIATLRGEARHSPVEQDFEDWQEFPAPSYDPNDGRLATRVSPNGDYLGFSSINSLTGADNEDANTHKPDKEIFLYDASTNQLKCASCSPIGEPPVGPTDFPAPERFAAEKPMGAPVYIPRNVLDNGRVFFTTPNALLPDQDIGERTAVYEYDEGTLYLISSGNSSSGSTFYDASANGEDVFFVTAQKLVSADTENTDSIYDARVDGGFAEPAVPPAPCESEDACRPGQTEVPVTSQPATPIFVGPGNVSTTRKATVSKCRRGRVRRNRKCVKPKHRARASTVGHRGKTAASTKGRGRR